MAWLEATTLVALTLLALPLGTKVSLKANPACENRYPPQIQRLSPRIMGGGTLKDKPDKDDASKGNLDQGQPDKDGMKAKRQLKRWTGKCLNLFPV